MGQTDGDVNVDRKFAWEASCYRYSWVENRRRTSSPPRSGIHPRQKLLGTIVIEGICDGLNVYVPLQIYSWNTNPQCGCFWRKASKEVIRSNDVIRVGPRSDRMTVPIRTDTRELALILSPCAHTKERPHKAMAGRWRLKARKRFLNQKPNRLEPWSWIATSGTVRTWISIV